MSPSQASETCASASSATSAKCRGGHYANASGGCQECLPPPAPGSISIEITIAAPISPDIYCTVPPEDTARKRYAPIRSTAIPAAVAGVVTINKLGTLPIHLRGPAATPLAHSFGRHTQHRQKCQHRDC